MADDRSVFERLDALEEVVVKLVDHAFPQSNATPTDLAPAESVPVDTTTPVTA